MGYPPHLVSNLLVRELGEGQEKRICSYPVMLLFAVTFLSNLTETVNDSAQDA